jgi:4-phospho-D-threonate 3-dehydrogenase / 4-phospho-D-erythronate 3-dehydrogenase
MKPIVAITLGDPAGIGPEIVVKALSNPKVHEVCRPLVVGARDVVSMGVEAAGLPAPVIEVTADPESGRYRPGEITLRDAGPFDLNGFQTGRVRAGNGKAAIEWLKMAVQMVIDGWADAVASAPVHKGAMHEAGYHFAGQTELLADMCGVSDFTTAVILGDLWIFQLTTHMSLRRALEAISAERLSRMFRLMARSLHQVGVKSPRMAVAGLNPHAGDGGLFGSEEIDIIQPAVAAARQEGLDVVGPVPADAVFLQARDGRYQAVLCLYHDQANIHLKWVGGGVTLTAGLPVIRTSTAHGTAFDIAGKGQADPTGMIECILTAGRLAQIRKTGEA